MKILIVDDDKTYLSKIVVGPDLQTLRFRISEFARTHPSIEVAVEEAISFHSDVVMLDHDMGAYKGRDFARLLKAKGFVGRIVGTSSMTIEQNDYCEKHVGKLRDLNAIIIALS